MVAGLGLASDSFSQTPLDNLVISVGTTIQDSSANNWSYVLLGGPQPTILAGKKFAVYGKAGYPTNAAVFSLRGTIFQQSDPGAITALLNESVSLGENLSALDSSLDIVLHSLPGLTNLTLGQKVAAAFQAANSDAGTAQTVALLAKVHPGLTLCLGQAFAEQISTTTTYELREVNPGTSVAGDVVGRVTVVPGSPVILPAPGAPFQLVTNNPIDHLRIRLRWGTPDDLRRLSLLSFGFNVWRIPRAAAEAAGYNITPPTLFQLTNDLNFVRANNAPVTATKDYSAGTGAGAADDPADPTTSFFSDANGRALGNPHFPRNSPPHAGYQVPAFNDGDYFYYFITARDVLERDGLASPGTLARACRRLPPQAPTGLKVLNNFTIANGQRLLLTWQQNTNADDAVGEYWVYRWPNPAMALTNDAVPLSNRVGVVTQLAGTNLNTFLDNGADAPTTPGLSNFWYTVRAVSTAACDPLLSSHSSPAWGVLRPRVGPDAATGDVQGSCGTPVVMFQTISVQTNDNGPDTLNWNYRFTCTRRDRSIAWVQFTFIDNYDGISNVLAQIYFPPNGDTLQFDYPLTITGSNYTNDVTCMVGTFYGQVSAPAVAHFTAQVSSNQFQEADFQAGALLETALSSTDPLLTTLNGGAAFCYAPTTASAGAGGTVGLTFPTPTGTPLFLQVLQSNAWVDLGVFVSDSNNVYWVSYPACLVGPLPAFQGCLINLPAGNGDCAQHVARASDSGPVAPIRIRFRLTKGTTEYRLYRSVDGGPLTLLSQGFTPYDPANPEGQVVHNDDAMPPGGAQLCYFVQVLDNQGNGSPMSFLGCKQLPAQLPPQPVLAEPQAAGSITNPQVALNWFCPTTGVARFELMIQRADGGGQPSGVASSKLTRLATFNASARFAGLTSPFHRVANFRRLFPLSQFDEGQLTPPIGANFGPGPQFSITASVLPNVPYNLSVVALNAQGGPGPASLVWKFTWKPPTVQSMVPWPARPLPPVTNFDEDVDPNHTTPRNIPPVFWPRVQATLMHGYYSPFDKRYPVGICIGYLDSISGQYIYSSNVGLTNDAYASYIVPPSGLGADPHDLIFRRLSGDPTRRGDLLLPIVVYRQQVTNANFPRVSGNLVQVTPLIERLPWSATFTGQTETIYLDDLLLALMGVFDQESYVTHVMLCVRDQQPVMVGASYRYLVVRFNDQHEIDEVIPAGVVTIPANP